MAEYAAAVSDEHLVNLYREKEDKNALGELFKRYSLMCFAVCNKFLRDEQAAEDAAMSIFEKLFTDLKQHEVKNFKSWLHSVCRNYCLMQLRKPVHTLRISRDDEETENNFVNLARLVHLEEKGEDKEMMLQSLEDAVKHLKDKQKQCITLFYLDQKSYDEIANITGFSLNEVKSHLQNGKRNLRNLLDGKELLCWSALLLWIQISA